LTKAASRAAICSARPTRTGLDARPLISGISIPCGVDIPESSLAMVRVVMAWSGGAAGGRLARLAGHLADGPVGAERSVYVVRNGGDDEIVVGQVTPVPPTPPRHPCPPGAGRPL